MTNKLKTVVVTGLLAVLLSSCAGAEVTEGTVTEIKHIDASTTTTMIPSGRVLVPMTQHTPECWRITVQDEEGTQDRWCVSEEDFNQTEVGQHWVRKSADKAA